MAERQTTAVTIGARILQLAPLRLGELKRVRAELVLLRAGPPAGDNIPTVEQLEAMATVVHASASVHDPALTREAFGKEIDELEAFAAIEQLSEAFVVVLKASDVTAVAAGSGAGAGGAPGEEPSTSPASTG